MFNKFKTEKKQKNLLIVLMLFLFSLSTVFAVAFQNTNSVKAIANNDTTNYVTVGELWNSSTSKFNQTNLNILYKYLTGNANATISDVDALANSTTDAATISSKTLSAGSGYSAKTSSQSVVVTLGGLEWTVTYLSKDKSGNTIATLWLTNNEQDVWSGRNDDLGELYGFYNGGLYSDWSDDWYYENSYNWDYPSNMYGTSYIRAVTLNNGGSYASAGSYYGEITSSSSITLATASQSSSNPFAAFTMSSSELRKYIVKPSQVSWQETESAVASAGFGSLTPNDAYGTPSSGSWYQSYMNYSSKTGYTTWANDYIWLPSMSETGNSGTSGIWQVNANERANYDGSTTSNLTGGVGTNNNSDGTYVRAHSWLRSGSSLDASIACLLDSSGSSYRSNSVAFSRAVRPALHLNLSLADDTIDISSATVSLSSSSYTYNGSTQVPTPTVTLNGETLTRNTDYTVTYRQGSATGTVVSSPINAGTYYVEITGTGSYVGTATSKPYFVINKYNLSSATATLSQTSYTYDGTAKRPSVTLTGNIYTNTGETSVWNGTSVTTPTGSGTEANPYIIDSASDLAWISANATTTAAGKYFKQTVNINLNNHLWTPINQSSTGRSYYYDGGNYQIQNINVNTTENYAGLFGNVSGGYLKNLGISSGSITSTALYVGGIVGLATVNNIEIINCFNNANIQGYSYVGGIAGYASYISYSYNTGKITGNGDTDSMYVGGISGCSGNISNCYNTGNVTGPAANGIAYAYNGSTENCYNFGNITSTASNRWASGIGYWRMGNAKNCYNIGLVSGVGSLYSIGGNVNGSNTNCYYNIETSGVSDNTGIGLRTLQMKSTTNGVAPSGMTGFSSDTWDFVAGEYPTLTGFKTASTTIPSSEYTISYSNNTNKGTATVRITARSTSTNYTGTKSVNFTINPKSIANATFNTIESQTYTGDPIQPKLEVKDGTKPLYKGTDYNVTYRKGSASGTVVSSIVDAGTYYVTITGTGNYTGTASTTRTFIVNPKNMSNTTVSSISNQTYTGDPIQPTVTVKDGIKTLTINKDYTVSYPEDSTNAGSKTITITGKGNYANTTTVTFNIVARSIENVTTSGLSAQIYNNGNEIDPEFTLIDSSTGTTHFLQNNTDYTYTLEDNVNVGTGKIIVTGKGNYTGSKTFEFSINPKSIEEKSSINIVTTATQDGSGNYVYNGTAPTFNLIVDGITLNSAKDYNTTYYQVLETNQTIANLSSEVGTYKIYVSGKGNYTGEIDKQFVIVSKSIADIRIDTIIENKVYTGEDFVIEDNLVSSRFNVYDDAISQSTKLSTTEYDIIITQGSATGTQVTEVINVGTYYITVVGKHNYKDTATQTVSFSVVKADISQGNITLNKSSYVYNQQTQIPTESITVGNNTLVKDQDYTVEYRQTSDTGEVITNPTNVGTYYVVLTGKGNYSGTKSISYTITQCSIANATVTLDAQSYVWQGKDIEAGVTQVVTTSGLTVPNTDYTVEYSNNNGAKTATVTITGQNNFTGTVTKDYVISCGTLNSFLYLNIGDNVSVNGTMYVTYNDEAFSPVVVVRDSLGNQLTEQDYTITYTRNGESTTDFESAGTITITATPKQNTTTGSTNYTGSSVGTFIINALDITDTAVIVVSGTYTYNGQGQEATIEVYATSGGKQLTVNTDYNTPTYQDNINAGDAQVSVTFKGNYTGSTTQTFVINKRDISDADINITGVNTEYTYNRFAQKPVPTVTDTEVLTQGTNTVLKETTDYTLTYTQDSTNAGPKTITITGQGNYGGTRDVNYTILAKDIADFTVTPSMIQDTVYTGSAIKPSITSVVWEQFDGTNNYTLSLSEYVVNYGANTNVGDAQVIIQGRVNYTGSITLNFEITPKSVENLTITVLDTNIIYTGQAISPSIEVRDGATVLVVGKDYSVSYGNNTNASEEATITITGMGNYNSATQKTVNFTISQRSIADGIVTGVAKSYTYTGIDIKPPFSLTVNGITLTEKDYEAEYTEDCINVGQKTITIQGQGNYTGELLEQYSITVADLEDCLISLPQYEYVYNGKSQTPTPTLTYNNLTVSDTNYTFNYSSDTINKGTVTITITATENGNFTGYTTVSYEITPKDIATIQVTGVEEKDYTGSAIRQNITLTDNDILIDTVAKILELDKDYKLEYSNNTNVTVQDGQVVEGASIEITGNGNYTGTKTVNFKINPIEITSLDLDAYSVTYDRTSHKPALTVKAGNMQVNSSYYTAIYTRNNEVTEDFTSAGTIVVTIKTNSNNFIDGIAPLTKELVITPATIDKVTLSVSSVVYNTQENKPVISSVGTVNGLELQDSEYTIAYTRNETTTLDFTNCGIITVTVSFVSSNFTGSASAEYEITQKDISDLIIKYYFAKEDGSLTDELGEPSDEKVYMEKDQTYKGQRVEAEITYIVSETHSPQLTKTQDYLYSFERITDGTGDIETVGEVTITIQGQGNYKGTITEVYKVTPADFTDENITITITNQNIIYTGSAITLTASDVEIRDKRYSEDNVLVWGEDFELYSGDVEMSDGETITVDKYLNNINVGRATVFFVGKGSYNQNQVMWANFEIKAKDINSSELSFTIEEIERVYTGSAYTPTLTTATFNGTPLVQGEDYTLSYNPNTNAGEAKVIIQGINNFAGTKEITFTISKKNIEDQEVVLTEISDKNYSIDLVKPDVIMTYNQLSLKETSDFTVTFKRQNSSGSWENTSDFCSIGIIQYEITGVGNYTGLLTKTYEIFAKGIAEVILSIDTIVYDRTQHIPTITVKDNIGDIIAENEYVISYQIADESGAYGKPTSTPPDFINVCKVKITATASSNSNYQGSSFAEFEITKKDINALTFDNSVIPLLTYNNTNITFTDSDISGILKYGSDYNLILNTDYAITYTQDQRVNAGEYNITLYGINNYSGNIQTTFTITPKQISDLTYNADAIKDKTYNGSNQTLSNSDLSGVLSWTVNELPYNLVLDTDYTITYTEDDRTNYGEYDITITGKGNYAGTIPSTFTVLQKNIEDITITYSQVSDTTYTGQAINPQITVTDTERRVALTTDIEITYGTENTDVSWENSEVVAKASVTIKGVGNYTGTKVIYFKVLPKQLTDSDITVESVGPQPYTGEKITPTPKVTWNARELTETEIVYSYGENTKVGYGSVTITAIENGNFDGSLDIQFTIGATDIQLTEISDIEQNLTYNRLEQKQTPTVTYNNNNLIKDTDYTLEYSSDLINKGTVTITIKGINNFIGTKTVTYNINAKPLTDTDITINGIQDEVTYTGNDITFNLSLSINEWEDFDLTESYYSTSYSNNKDVSWLDGVVQANASVTINFVGNFTGSITKYYTIQPKALEDGMLTQILNQTYTGQEIRPDITITYNNIQYGNNFFTVDYNTNINVGQASVDISAKPNSNFTGSLSTNFNITAKVITDLSLFDVTITTPEDGFIYKASAYTPDITISVKSSSDTLNKDTDYTVSYGDNTSAGNGEIYITFIKNYDGTVTQTFTIQKRMLTDSAVTYTNLTSVTYDGEEHKQSPVLTLLDSYTLDSSDYICEFKRNNEITTDFVSTGTITVVVTGQGNFDGTLSLSYNISSKDFNSSEVTVNILDTNIVYTGSKITPEIEVKYGELTLEKDVNYSVEYGENLNALTKGTITITAIDGNYTGSKTVEFDIQQKEITLSMISSIQEQSYTGGKIEPEVTITYNEMTLEKDTDFNANYTDNINVGPASIEITGIGNYTGTVNISFEITPLTFIEEDGTLNIDITWTDGTPDLIYTGSEHTPIFSLQYTKENLEAFLQETDYTYEYKDNTKAGLATLQVTGKGNYIGTVEFNFTIKTKDLDLSMFQALDDVTYTGQEIKPDIIGEFNSTPLLVNVDYSVLYENNQNAGLATVKITGKGNFTNNEVILTFNINKRSITELILSDEDVIYNGSKFNITLTVTADNLTLNSTDYELTYEDISGGIIDIPNLTDAGKTVFVVTGINNFTGTLKQTLTIQTKNFIDEDIVVTGVINKDYNLGLPITQTISVQYGDLSLNEFEHYDVKYENNQNAGLASIILTGKGNYSGSKTINFTISQISPTVNPYLPDRTYFEGDNVPQLLLHTNDTKGTITITETVILLGTNDYNWTFIPTDTTNYLTTSGTISITGIALEVVSIEFDGAYKSEYNAYEPFNPTGIIVFANYNNGDRIEIAEGYYTLSLTAGEPVTMQNAKIQVFAETFYEGSMEVELTVNPLPLTVTFDNYSNLVETEAKQYISISIDGELPDYSADITYSYLNLKTGTESDGITLNGDYTVTVKVGNNNYYIEGEDSISFNVKVGIIYDNPETRNVIVISTTGFDNDVTVTIDTYITENEIQEILGNVNTEAEVVYVVRLWKNGEAYIPTNDYIIQIKVDSSLLSNQNLQVYTLEGTYLKNISYSTISNNYIELGTNTMGTIVLSMAVQDMTLVWLILGMVLLLLIIIVVTVFSIRYTTKQRIKRIRNMSKNKTTQENKE